MMFRHASYILLILLMILTPVMAAFNHCMVEHGVSENSMAEMSSLVLNQKQATDSVSVNHAAKVSQICHLTTHCNFHSCHFSSLLVSKQRYLAAVIRTDYYFDNFFLSSIFHSPELRPPIA